MTAARLSHRPAIRRFTGWHMLAIMVAFFGTVIAVNVLMARLALSTFSGEVVENSYVASQQFNGWLAEARAERLLGWHTTIAQRGNRLTLALSDASGRPITGARISGEAAHPLGRSDVQALVFHEGADGVYAADLLQARWQVRLVIAADGHRLHRQAVIAGAGAATDAP